MVARVLDPSGPRGLSAPAPPPQPGELAGLIARWWQNGPRQARDGLPWRRLRDPWAVLCSELMLAQTQTARVAERFPGFLGEFPTPAAMAKAGPAAVIRAWSGLGYNRRALALFRLAEQLVSEHAGEVPDDLVALLALPGVGGYTARAVLAFAFDRRVGVVDTNIARLLARAIAGAPLSATKAQQLADSLVTGSPREWNLALMDLGALACRARSPRCDACPLAEAACAMQEARRRGESCEDPALRTAGTARRQAAFAGSDRQLRGRLLRAACSGVVRLDELASAEPERERLEANAAALVSEGLLMMDHLGRLRLPEGRRSGAFSST